MSVLTQINLDRTLEDIAEHGDNDVLPFDPDTKFISERRGDIARSLLGFADVVEKKTRRECEAQFEGFSIFCERLLAPAGPSGFRTTTKIHPIWNAYLTSLCVAVAERHEMRRSSRVHSYRLAESGASLFRREKSWRQFREATVAECSEAPDTAIVVQTDVSSFYGHVYHHRLENYVRDELPSGSNLADQINILLKKCAAGRSFGLPVGSQGARILAEVLMSSVDRTLSAEGLRWHRYVDDFVLIADQKRDAYGALGVLANALADLGLNLNRNKTSLLSKRHYCDYVDAQLNGADDASSALREVDLYFDPYSDNPDEDYEDLRDTVSRIDIEHLLGVELDKGQPDSFIVAQAGRALQLMDPDQALSVCITLLEAGNLHAFRANWSSIMRGISRVLGNHDFAKVFDSIDALLDRVVEHSPHLVSVDANLLHFLRALRHRRSDKRAAFVLATYKATAQKTIRRSCIGCWGAWQDRDRFVSLRNEWEQMSSEEQRMLWLVAGAFGDDGHHFRRQVRRSLSASWKLGMERRSVPDFAETYAEWASADE